ncbi:hypothetical protein C8Q77DRAFT_1232241 [Trametes polyzona]|nr:hypothetical protein C8Q77DRAFT_1232241 [Trametes polyzona]
MPLQYLPEDVLLDIFQHLSVNDILSLRLTCRGLALATRQRTVWHDCLSRHARKSGLPIPNSDESARCALSSSELEALTLRSIRFWSNWQCPRPLSHRHVAIQPRLKGSPPNNVARNLAVVFFPGYPAHILTLTLYDHVTQHRERRYNFELWDISDLDRVTCIDELPIEALLGYAVNTVRGSVSTMIITRRDPTSHQCLTEAYRLVIPRMDASCFHRIHEFPGYRNTLRLHGTRLIATDAEQDVRLIDVTTGRLEYTLKPPVMLNDPTLRFAERQCMDAVVVGDYVLTFCKQYIFLYRLPSTSVPSNAHIAEESLEAPRLEAIATYKWRWRIDALIAQPRLGSPGASGASTSRPPLIDLLIRFDTWFPWPVNILHHFVLAPNPSYDPSAANTPSHPAALPYALSTPEGAPFMVHSIPSPLRIFTPSDVALGVHGTAVWIDAAADGTGPAAAQAGDRGQRVAGKVLTRAPLPLPRMRVRPGEGAHDDAVSPGLVEPPVLAMGAGAGTEGDGEAEETEASAERRLGVSGSEVSVFHVQADMEKWSRIAVDEESGRIAVGQVDGTVSVDWYVPA